jgi:hypothetical protein
VSSQWSRQVERWEARGLRVEYEGVSFRLVDEWGRETDTFGFPLEMRHGQIRRQLHPAEPRTCPGCARRFLPNRKNQEHCSGACRQKAFRRRKAGEK